MNDLFLKPKSKKEQVYDFIRERKWARTSDVIRFASSIFSNRGDRDARQLCEEKRIFRMRENLKRLRFSDTKEDIYTIYEYEK